MSYYGPKFIINYFNETLDIYELFENLETDPYLIEEVIGLECISPDTTSSLIFRDNNKIIGLCLDYNKMLFLKQCNYLPDFKYIRFAEYINPRSTEVSYVMIYEMKYLLPIVNDSHITMLDSLYTIKSDKEACATVLNTLNVQFNNDLAEEISRKSYLPKFDYDYHRGQFMLNNNDIICIDPIVSCNMV